MPRKQRPVIEKRQRVAVFENDRRSQGPRGDLAEQAGGGPVSMMRLGPLLKWYPIVRVMMGQNPNRRRINVRNAGHAGDRRDLHPGSAPLRSQGVAEVGADVWEGTDRIPPRAERTQIHVRPRNEKPGAGNRIVKGSHQRVSVRYVQLRLFVV